MSVFLHKHSRPHNGYSRCFLLHSVTWHTNMRLADSFHPYIWSCEVIVLFCFKKRMVSFYCHFSNNYFLWGSIIVQISDFFPHPFSPYLDCFERRRRKKFRSVHERSVLVILFILCSDREGIVCSV